MSFAVRAALAAAALVTVAPPAAGSPDRFFTPIDHPEIWLKAGDPTIYFSPPP